MITPLTLPSPPVPFSDPGFRPAPLPTNCSTAGEDVAAIPWTAKALTVVDASCLRSPMPALAWPVPAVMLPEMSAHTSSSIETPLPASTLMPLRKPVNGAATVLVLMVTFRWPVASRAVAMIPVPSVWLTLLLVIRTVSVGVSALPKVELVPAPMPLAAAWLFATMTLLLMSAVTLALPRDDSAITVPIELPSGLRAVPLFRMLKLPCPLPLTTARIACVPRRFAALKPDTRLPVIAMTLAPFPGVPYVPDGPAAFPLPPCAMIPAALGKLETMLLAMVAFVTLAIVPAEPNAMNRMPVPFDVTVELVLVIVLFEMFASPIVPLKLKMSMP